MLNELELSELKYMIESSIINYAKELLGELDEIFKDYKEGDSISDLLEDNDAYGTLIGRMGDIEQTIYRMGNLDNCELYTKNIKELYRINEKLDDTKITGKENLEESLYELIKAVRKIKI